MRFDEITIRIAGFAVENDPTQLQIASTFGQVVVNPNFD